jgi:hypothetical protein
MPRLRNTDQSRESPGDPLERLLSGESRATTSSTNLSSTSSSSVVALRTKRA